MSETSEPIKASLARGQLACVTASGINADVSVAAPCSQPPPAQVRCGLFDAPAQQCTFPCNVVCQSSLLPSGPRTAAIFNVEMEKGCWRSSEQARAEKNVAQPTDAPATILPGRTPNLKGALSVGPAPLLSPRAPSNTLLAPLSAFAGDGNDDDDRGHPQPPLDKKRRTSLTYLTNLLPSGTPQKRKHVVERPLLFDEPHRQQSFQLKCT